MNEIKMNEIKLNEDFYFFNCPQCNLEVIVNKNELNCRIFRHAVYKNNYEQVNPHLSYEDCQKLLDTNSVIGCCKPFQIISKNDKLYAIICDYI